MTTTPRFGATDWAAAQASPWTVHNDALRRLEAGAGRFAIADRVTAPPGTCADGASYIIIATATGAFAGKEGQIATAVGANAASGWLYLTLAAIHEGATAYVQDENADYRWDGSAWGTISSGGASTTQTTEMIGGFIAAPADKSYTIALKMAHGGTITETTTISAAGTCTATFKVNSTALGGTANSVSSSEQSQAHASTNTFVAGDDIVLTVSSNSSCADMSFSIKYTRTLE